MANRPSPIGIRVLPLCPLALWLAPGCSNPLHSKSSDYARQMPPERTRQIEPLTMQPKPAPENPPDPAASARSRFQGLTEAPLTIEEARASALEHNLDLKVSLLAPSIAREAENEQGAKFEPDR